MNSFFSYIYGRNIFLLVIITILIFIIYPHLILRLRNTKIRILCNSFVLVLISVFILYKTILSRTSGSYDVILFPFHFFKEAQIQSEIYRSFFMNILLFVPLGMSMPYVLLDKPHKRNIFITIGFASVLSAGIEFSQYYYHLGRYETDDIIANIFGAAIGTLSYCLYIKICRNQEKGSLMQKINNNQRLLLDLCAKSLFDKEINITDKFDCKELLCESKRQTVFSIIYSLVKNNADEDSNKLFSKIIAKNIRVEFAHNEVHHVLSENNIPYVILKGVASASYYKEPMLRMMGDVDILVSPEDITRADTALESIGFVTNETLDGDDKHVSYKRRDGIICELHREANGVPKNAVGEKIRGYFSDIFEKSVEYKTANGSCMVPDKFHHGLILLLHTANHLTKEGIGLRHLCDWAVFVNNISNEEFIKIFEKPLNDIGLWHFAKLLTGCCIKYLYCDEKIWAGKFNDNLMFGIISDILNGGNFGSKDADRYKQIKYISNRKKNQKSKKGPVAQLLSSIDAKTKYDFSFVKKNKVLLPIGWLLTIFKYFYMVLIGKRSLDSISTINEAKNRVDIYNEFHLFE